MNESFENVPPVESFAIGEKSLNAIMEDLAALIEKKNKGEISSSDTQKELGEIVDRYIAAKKPGQSPEENA